MEEPSEKSPLVMHCPECERPLDVAGLPPYAKIECPHCASHIRVRSVMGQYQIVGVLGEGGMSQVFRALDRNLGREVALKVLHQSLSRDAALTAMFEREAKLTAAIVHPNVVKVFSVGEDAGYFFIAMELLQATSLEQLIATKGALSESEVLSIALDVSRGLKAAYDEQLIHRDIKPGNMLVTEDGVAKLVDFGLAVQQGGEDLSEDLWATPYYVPPEKLEGATDTFLGDIYSLGATLYHALAGKPPFDANTSSMEELKAIKRNTVDLKSVAPGLSKSTVRLVEKMMAYRPEDRIDSYETLIAQIEEVRSRHFGIVEAGRGRSSQKQIKTLLAVGGGVITLVAIILGITLSQRGNHDDGNLGISNAERVISVGDRTITERFSTARERFAAGEFGEATELFSALVSDEAVPSSTRIWSYFCLGTIRLFTGEPTLSRETFHNVLATTPEEAASSSEAMIFLKRAAVGLSEPLPLLTEEVNYASDSVEAFGLLAAGLKNWQDGEFDSGARYLKAFRESQLPEVYAWIGGLKAQIEPFLADKTLLETLPNPVATATETELDAEAETLRQALTSLRTSGAAPRLVKQRIERVGAIRKLASETVASLPSAVVSPPSTAAASTMAVPLVDQPMAGPASPSTPVSESERAELEKLKTVLTSLRHPVDPSRLGEAKASLEAEEVTTPLGMSLRDRLLELFQTADQYVEELVVSLEEGPTYEGVIRRREGRAIEAAITSANAEMFIVDLGFGPNEVAVVDFAPDWLLELGLERFPSPTQDTAWEWETLISYAFVNGLGKQVERQIVALATVDPEFLARWRPLKPFLDDPAP